MVMARLPFLIGVPMAVEQAQSLARASLKILDTHLKDRTFLELGHPTIADFASFSCAALAPEGQVALNDFPQVRERIKRIQALPYDAAMPGLEVSA
jgi:glutathione S-transferase